MSEQVGTPRVGLIWAQSEGGVIGLGGVMPWHVPEDLAHFKRVTLGSPVVMGRKTWDSLPERFRPLPGRRNIVVTRQEGWASEGAERAHSVEAGLALASDGLAPGETVWVMGGGEIFSAVIDRADELMVTELRARFDGDTLAPSIGPRWMLREQDPEQGWHSSRTGIEYRFCRYRAR